MPLPALARRHGFLLSLLLGVVAAAGFAPLGWWPVTLVALAAWMGLVHEALTLRQALARSWAFGIGYLTIGNAWIQHAFTFQEAMPSWLGYPAVALLALCLALFPMFGAALAWRLASPRAAGDTETPPGIAFVLVFGAAWMGSEWLRGTMFTGYPWNPMAAIWLRALGVAQLAKWVGTYALGGLTLVAAGTLLTALQRRWVPLATGVAVIGIALLTGVTTPGAARPELRAVVVQPNLGEEVRPTGHYAENNLAALERAMPRPDPTGPARLVVWPEGAIRYYLEDGYPADYYFDASAYTVRRRIARLLGPRDVVMTGGSALLFDRAGNLDAATNSVFAIDGAGVLHDRYDKAHLVPFGEYLPMRPLLSRIGLQRLVPGEIDFRDGPGPRTITLPGIGRIGVQICYEIIFSGELVDRADRPDLLFNPSNDSWYGDQGPEEHLAMTRLRAIEEGLPILRSTPTGISAVIDANGVLVAAIGLHQAGAIDVPMPVAHPPTLFARTGNWMVPIVAAILVAAAVALRRRRR